MCAYVLYSYDVCAEYVCCMHMCAVYVRDDIWNHVHMYCIRMIRVLCRCAVCVSVLSMCAVCVRVLCMYVMTYESVCICTVSVCWVCVLYAHVCCGCMWWYMKSCAYVLIRVMRVLCTCAICVCMQIHLYCIRDQLPMHLEPVLSHVECTCTCYLRHRAGVHMAVFFAEYRLFYRALLQKRPIICIWGTGRVYIWRAIHTVSRID